MAPGSRSLLPAYILAGPEQGKRSAFVTGIKENLAKRDGQSAEVHRLYAHETDAEGLVLLLRNGSLFASSRIVEFHGAENLKGKTELASLLSYLASPNHDATLLLITENFGVDRALEDAIGKDAKVVFYEMFENEKDRWVRSRLSQAGITIDEDGVDALLGLVENESQALEAACMALAAGFPKGASIGSAEVETAIARTRREDAFSLFERLAEGELDRALAALDAVLADRQGNSVQILSALVWSFRRLLKLQRAVSGGTDFEGACQSLGIRGKGAQKIVRAAMTRYTADDCSTILRLLSSTDALARSTGQVLERSLLQLALYGIIMRRGELDPGAQTGAFL